MAALGIWLWSNAGSFGTANNCAISQVSTVILGGSIPLGSRPTASNLILPMGLFLGLFLTVIISWTEWVQTWRGVDMYLFGWAQVANTCSFGVDDFSCEFPAFKNSGDEVKSKEVGIGDS
ncbi:hypothetical protein C8J57DRAFT_1237186 [Mycena rebaudengoi]|nr:hypothetical protein C8J57DRAFT_1237186 [Mycena rebaudengoi]